MSKTKAKTIKRGESPAGAKRYEAAFNQAAFGVVQVDMEGRVVVANEKAEAILGFEPGEMSRINLREYMHDEERDVDLDRVYEMLCGNAEVLVSEKRMRTKTGRYIWASLTTSIVRDTDGAPVCYLSVMEDITERKKLDQELKLSQAVINNTQEGILITDGDNKVIFVNPAFSELTGYGVDEVLGKDPSFLSSGKQGPEFYARMWKSIFKHGKWRGEIWDRRKDGSVYPKMMAITDIKDEEGTTTHRAAVFNDITELKDAQEKIHQQAYYDALTSLPNRSLFEDRLAQSILASRREKEKFALLYLDLDKFKDINDTLGHRAGDELLVQFSKRLEKVVRDSDTVCRLGGDEFTIILNDINDHFDAKDIGEKVLQSLQAPFNLEGTECFISGSIGIAMFPDDSQDGEDLLRCADTAMYEAKKTGRAAIRFFTPTMQEEVTSRMAIAMELRRATKCDELQVYYQPIVKAATGKVVKAEALLRWIHPIKGMISPAEFIPVAEETGLIDRVGEWLFKRVLADIASWKDELTDPIVISINVSPQQFERQDVKKILCKGLKDNGLLPEQIVVEITESVLMGDEKEAIRQLHKINNAGIQIALDDFGTGYSSLSYLKKLPISLLKIDQSFVRDLDTDKDSRTMVKAIVSMCGDMNFKVIAEGVETEIHQDFLKGLNCDFLQGYYFSRPCPKDEFIDFCLRQNASLKR